jgi:hypothetical protein
MGAVVSVHIFHPEINLGGLCEGAYFWKVEIAVCPSLTPAQWCFQGYSSVNPVGASGKSVLTSGAPMVASSTAVFQCTHLLTTGIQLEGLARPVVTRCFQVLTSRFPVVNSGVPIAPIHWAGVREIKTGCKSLLILTEVSSHNVNNLFA